jgi:hypothetical protein
VVSFKNGALIAIAAGTLFAAACKEADEKAGGDMKTGDVKAEEGKTGAMKADGTKTGEKTAKAQCMGLNSCKLPQECPGWATRPAKV